MGFFPPIVLINNKDLERRFGELSVLVIGDMCLDIDYIGGYSGYSREQEQLPIFRVEVEKRSPGGAGNVAMCFATLGIQTSVAGYWGNSDDMNRRSLEACFNSKDINTEGMVVGGRTPTFGKCFQHNGRHIYRIDLIAQENSQHDLVELGLQIKNLSEKIAFIACADYEEVNEYGVCSEGIIEIIRQNPKPRFATSRNNIKRFRGFHYLIGNEKEITDRVDGLEWLQAIMTMGGKGAIVYRPESIGIKVESQNLAEIIDPCGCGDMFYASYASCVMSGFDTITSLQIANASARVVAKKLFGTGQSNCNEIVNEWNILYGKGG